MSDDRCREAFETWVNGFFDLRRLENGLYLSEETRLRWNLWADCWQARQPEIAELARALEHMIEEYESVNGSEPWHDEYRELITKNRVG